MTTEHAPVGTRTDLATPAAGAAVDAVPDVDETIAEIVPGLTPGRALDLGCGRGQDVLWLARRGWKAGGVDHSPDAIAEADGVARAFGIDAVFEVHDITAWRPRNRYDLVTSTFSLPAKGAGRSRMLDMTRDAVAPGGMIIIKDLDISLGRDGWMSERYLVGTNELERIFDGFRIVRSAVRLGRHRIGTDERVLPIATFVATRRTDLRTI